MNQCTQSWNNLKNEIVLINKMTKRNLGLCTWVVNANIYICQRNLYIRSLRIYNRVAKRHETKNSIERFLIIRFHLFLKSFYFYLGLRQAYFSEGPPKWG